MGGERDENVAESRTEGWYAALSEAPDRLRASDLNEVLLPDHLDRLRFTNFPLQAHGMMFKWETIVGGALEVYRRPWQLVAEENNLRVPDDDEVMRSVGMRPERAIQQTFMWTDDWGQTQQLAFAHFEAKVTERTPAAPRAHPGLLRACACAWRPGERLQGVRVPAAGRRCFVAHDVARVPGAMLRLRGHCPRSRCRRPGARQGRAHQLF